MSSSNGQFSNLVASPAPQKPYKELDFGMSRGIVIDSKGYIIEYAFLAVSVLGYVDGPGKQLNSVG